MQLMRKNQYEEALFRCEDDRYELDMCIETSKSTLSKLQPLATSFAAMSPEDKALYRLPEGLLGAIHFRAAERIYGDQVWHISGEGVVGGVVSVCKSWCASSYGQLSCSHHPEPYRHFFKAGDAVPPSRAYVILQESSSGSASLEESWWCCSHGVT